MYKPLFEKGDVIIPNKKEILTHRICKDIIQIYDIIIINNTTYYSVYSDVEVNNDAYNCPIHPCVDIDKCYQLDKMYLRKEKVENIIYNTKVKQNIENE